MPDKDKFVGPGGPSWHMCGTQKNSYYSIACNCTLNHLYFCFWIQIMFAFRKGQVRLKVNPLDLDQKPLWAFLVEVSLSLSLITTYCQQSLLYLVVKSNIYQINNRLSFIITHCQQSLVNPWLRWEQLQYKSSLHCCTKK